MSPNFQPKCGNFWSQMILYPKKIEKNAKKPEQEAWLFKWNERQAGTRNSISISPPSNSLPVHFPDFTPDNFSYLTVLILFNKFISSFFHWYFVSLTHMTRRLLPYGVIGKSDAYHSFLSRTFTVKKKSLLFFIYDELLWNKKSSLNTSSIITKISNKIFIMV